MSKSVLIVDDDLMLCELFSTGFQLAGFEVSVVHDGISALEFLETHPVDAITLDHDMPGLSGKEVLEQLKDSDLAENTSIIVVSANESIRTDEVYKELSDHILIKPVGFRQLTHLAEKLIEEMK